RAAAVSGAWRPCRPSSPHGGACRAGDPVGGPPPPRQPPPPLWVAAASAPSIRRAAEEGFNLLLDQYASPAQISERIALFRSVRQARGHRFDPLQVAVARQLYVAHDKAEAEAALALQALVTRRIVDVSRTPGTTVAGSHVLSYAATPGATEANALYDTPERVADELHALRRAGAEYVLLTTLGGAEQLRRFAHEVMPSVRMETAPRSPNRLSHAATNQRPFARKREGLVSRFRPSLRSAATPLPNTLATKGPEVFRSVVIGQVSRRSPPGD